MKEKTNLFLIIFFLITFNLVSCSSDNSEDIRGEFSNEGNKLLELKLDENTYLEIGTPVSFEIINNLDDLVVFPKDRNTKVYMYDETNQEWIEVQNDFGRVVSKDKYTGLQTGNQQAWFASPIIENAGKPVKIRITVSGWIYKGNMEEFEESGITNEVVTGSIEVTLQPPELIPFGQ